MLLQAPELVEQTRSLLASSLGVVSIGIFDVALHTRIVNQGALVVCIVMQLDFIVVVFFIFLVSIDLFYVGLLAVTVDVVDAVESLVFVVGVARGQVVVEVDGGCRGNGLALVVNLVSRERPGRNFGVIVRCRVERLLGDGPVVVRLKRDEGSALRTYLQLGVLLHAADHGQTLAEALRRLLLRVTVHGVVVVVGVELLLVVDFLQRIYLLQILLLHFRRDW